MPPPANLFLESHTESIAHANIISQGFTFRIPLYLGRLAARVSLLANIVKVGHPLEPRILQCPERRRLPAILPTLPLSSRRASELMKRTACCRRNPLSPFISQCPSGLDPTGRKYFAACPLTHSWNCSKPHSLVGSSSADLCWLISFCKWEWLAPSRMPDIQKGGLCCTQMIFLKSGDAVSA